MGGKFKFLYKDFKPDEKLSEKALELFRRVPRELSLYKIKYFFKYNFDVDAAVEGLRKWCLSEVGHLYHVTLEEAEIPSFFGFALDSVKIPENVERRYWDAWGRGLEERRKVVEEIFRQCNVFKILENLYIVETLIKFEGYRYFVVKTGELAKKYVYEDVEGRKIRELGGFRPGWFWSVDRKTRIRVLPTMAKLPESITVLDKLAEDLIYEVDNGKVYMCSFSLYACDEAVELIRELKNDPEIWSIEVWQDEAVYNRELDYAYEELDKLQGRYCMAIAPEYDLEKPWRNPENVEAFRKAGWGEKNCIGLVVVSSNGFDYDPGYMNFMRLEKYYEWREKFLKWNEEHGLDSSKLRGFYNI